MIEWYGWIQLVHLACAIVFAGAVTFEVVILESLHASLGAAEMERIEGLILRRARRVMPFAVALLYLSGAAMFEVKCAGGACLGSRFGLMLGLKVLLALGVLGVFLSTMWAALRRARPVYRATATVTVATVLAHLAGVWLGAVFSGSDAALATAAVGGFVTSWFVVVLAAAAFVSSWAGIALVHTRAQRPRWPWERDEDL